MKIFIRNTIILIGLVLVDQLLKMWVFTQRFFVDLGIVSFHYVSNTGASFGILRGQNTMLTWISVIVLGLIMMTIDKVKKEHEYPVILLTAGLLGNLIDRLFRGFVIDFIDLKFWPVFNIADSLIVIGVIWLGLVLIISDYKESKEKKLIDKINKRDKQKRKIKKSKKVSKKKKK